MQHALFPELEPGRPSPASTRIELGDGAWLDFRADWLPADEGLALFRTLREEVSWESVTIKIMGKPVLQPRLTAWYGDAGASYRYSGRRFEPLRWTTSLAALADRLRAATGHGWNSCLCNLYRDGRDSMGLHADDEPELGPMPQVASVSLGATRRFVLRHRTKKGLKRELELPHGSLLLMGGSTQLAWKHEVPKTAAPVGERINLTFRKIDPSRAR